MSPILIPSTASFNGKYIETYRDIKGYISGGILTQLSIDCFTKLKAAEQHMMYPRDLILKVPTPTPSIVPASSIHDQIKSIIRDHSWIFLWHKKTHSRPRFKIFSLPGIHVIGEKFSKPSDATGHIGLSRSRPKISVAFVNHHRERIKYLDLDAKWYLFGRTASLSLPPVLAFRIAPSSFVSDGEYPIFEYYRPKGTPQPRCFRFTSKIITQSIELVVLSRRGNWH